MVGPRFELLERTIEQRVQELADLEQNFSPVLDNESNIADEPTGGIWDRLKNTNKWELYTNFSEDHLLSLYRVMIPHANSHRRRGPLPKISYADGLIILLTFYKTALEYDKLAAFLGFKLGTLKNAVDRMRPILYDTLHELWLENRRRPTPLNETHFPHVALLIDSTSTKVFRPKVPFQEAKMYWDGKNSMYALKKEVAVMASKPHFCLFLQKGVIGSKHDYEYLKETFHLYIPYLQKMTEEFVQLPSDHGNQNWSALFDKGYVGPDNDTPGLRRITPKKNTSAYADLIENEEKSKIRVPVECFFGRQQKLWKIIRETYRWDHKNFDIDFDNCALLTNEHIKQKDLQEIDKNFALRIAGKRMIDDENNRNKKAEQENYRAKKRLRITAMLN